VRDTVGSVRSGGGAFCEAADDMFTCTTYPISAASRTNTTAAIGLGRSHRRSPLLEALADPMSESPVSCALPVGVRAGVCRVGSSGSKGMSGIGV